MCRGTCISFNNARLTARCVAVAGGSQPFIPDQEYKERFCKWLHGGRDIFSLLPSGHPHALLRLRKSSGHKKDNWEQLKKFSRKKGFTVVNDEIDNIIQCTSDDGAAPLLERMYNFLNQKPKVPENVAQQPTVGHHTPSPGWTNQPGAEYTQRDDEGEEESSRSDSDTYSVIDGESDDCARIQDDLNCEESRQYDGLVRLGHEPDGCRYELRPLVRLDHDENGDELFSSVDSGCVRFLDDEGDQREESEGRMEEVGVVEDDFLSKKTYVNAVEKARQREGARTRRLSKAGVKAGLSGTEIKQKISGRKSCTDAALAFRSPNRSRKMNFRQYTLPDYRRQKQFGYVQLGSLGPKDDPELISKMLLDKTRQILERVKEFGRHARSCNTMSHSNPALANPKRPSKPSSRKVALEFASSIPKPKRKIVKHHSKENSKIALPIQNPHGLTDLQILEMKHQSHKELVEAIRRDLEHFLR